jgi:hypothetical protein
MRRFSIRGLMAGVLLLGVAISALRESTPLWASVTFSATLLSVLVGIIGSVQCSGRGRAGWFGYALGGGIYLALALGPVLSEANHQRLLSSHLVKACRLEAQIGSRRNGMTVQLGVLQARRATMIDEQRTLAERVGKSPSPKLEESLALIARQLRDIDILIAERSPDSLAPAFWARWLPDASRDREFAVIVHCLTSALVGIACAGISIYLRHRSEPGPPLRPDPHLVM